MQQSHSHHNEDSGAQVSAIVKALHCPVPTASPTSFPTPLYCVTPITVISLSALGMPFSQKFFTGWSFCLEFSSLRYRCHSHLYMLCIMMPLSFFKKKKKLFIRLPCVLSGGRRDLLVTVGRLFQLRHAGDLVPRPGIELGPAALGMGSLNPWATKYVSHMPLSPWCLSILFKMTTNQASISSALPVSLPHFYFSP